MKKEFNSFGSFNDEQILHPIQAVSIKGGDDKNSGLPLPGVPPLPRPNGCELPIPEPFPTTKGGFGTSYLSFDGN